MAQVIKLKRSSVAGKAPSTSDLQLGEIAVNTADGKIYFEKNDGSPSVQTILTTNSQTTGSIEITGNISGSAASTGSFGHIMVGGGNFTSASLAAGGGSGEDNEFSFKTISVSGQSDVVADTTTDTLTFAAGSNMTITTNAGSDTITFASAGGASVETASKVSNTHTSTDTDYAVPFIGSYLSGTHTLYTDSSNSFKYNPDSDTLTVSNIVGTATSANSASKVQNTHTATDADYAIPFLSSYLSGHRVMYTDSSNSFKYNPDSDTLTVSNIAGATIPNAHSASKVQNTHTSTDTDYAVPFLSSYLSGHRKMFTDSSNNFKFNPDSDTLTVSNIVGTVTTANSASKVQNTHSSTDADYAIPFIGSYLSGHHTMRTDSGNTFKFNPSSDTLTVDNVTVSGNLTVTGTTTSINSTTLNIGDRIIEIAGSATSDAGIYVRDATGSQTGSLLWDVSENRWMGGLKDSEVNLVTISSTDTLTNKTLTSPDINGGTIDDVTRVSGSAASTGSFGRIEGDGGGITLIDGNKISLGSDNDGSIKHTGTNLQILETTGNIQLINYANDKDVVLSTDDGSGGTTAYITLDGSTTKVEIAKDTNFAGNVSGSVASTGSFGHLMVGGGNFTSASLAGGGSGTGFPFTGSAGLSGSMDIIGSGSNIFTVDGTNGRLFSVSDEMSGSVFSANLVSGLPVIEAFSDNIVKIGAYADPIIISGSGMISGSSASTASFGHYANISASVAAAGFGSGGGGGAVSAVANGSNNRIATFSSADALNGEANLTFDGSTLGVTGAITATGNISSSLTSTGSFGHLRTTTALFEPTVDRTVRVVGSANTLLDLVSTDANAYIKFIDSNTSSPGNWFGSIGNNLIFYPNDGSSTIPILTLTSTSVSGSAASTGSFGSLVVSDKVQGNLTLSGNVTPSGNNAKNLGAASNVWANFYAYDIHGTRSISGSAVSTGSFGHLMVGGGNFTSASLAAGGGGGGSDDTSWKTGTATLFSGSLASSASFGKGGVKIIDSDLETQVITRDWDLSTVSLDKYMQDGGVSDEWGDGWGITASPDGRNVYVSLIGSGDLADSIAQYSLSGSWDIGSRTLHGSKSVATQGSLHRAMVFSPDGTKLITMDTDNSKYNEYDLTKPWDITTLTYVQNATLQGSSQQGITAKPDGSALYQIGENDSVLELGMTTAWDVSTISVTSTTSVSGDGGTEHSDIFFRPDGRFAYLFDKNAKDLHEWKLSTPWKFSTAAYTGKNTNMSGLIKVWGNPEGTRLFGLDYGNERINQYSWNGGPSAHQTSSIDIIGKTGIGGDAIIYQNLDVHGKVNGYDAEFKGDISGSATSTGSFAHLKVGGGNFTSASLAAGGGGGSGPSAAQVSGSWRGELSSSAVTVVGGGVSGSSVSTGSFGHIMVGGGNFTSASLAGGGGGASNAFKTISVSGQSDVVADSATDTLTLVAGSNMTLTTSAGGDSITFASSGGGGGSGTNSGSYTFTQAGDSTSWAITHSLGTKHNAVTVYDDSHQVVIPTSITADDANKTTIGFSSATSGYAVINSGGTTGTVTRISTDGSHVHHQSGDSTNWVITHSLNSKYPNVTVYDDSDEVIIPTSIKADTLDTATVTFSAATAGRAIFSMGGNLSGSLTSTGSFGRVDVQDGFYDGGTKLSVPDYVFEPEYELKSISELDVHISQSKHLPNVPDMNAIEEWKQLSMGDRDMLLLEKIEEMSLYIIQLHKRLEKLEKKS